MAPGVHDPEQTTLKVFNTLLSGGMSSRLFQTLREQMGLAYEVSTFYASRFDRSPWGVYLGLPEDKLSVASRTLEEILDQLAEKGPTQEEMIQAKHMIRGGFLMELQTSRRQAWYAAWWEFIGRGADYGSRFLSEVEAVTPGAVHHLARRLLSQPRVSVTVVPK